MNITVTEIESGVAVIRPEGRLGSATKDAFEDAVETVLKRAEPIIIDLSATDYMASMALRVLLMAAKVAKASDFPFAISGPNENILEVLRISGFTSVLTICDDLEAAKEFIRT